MLSTHASLSRLLISRPNNQNRVVLLDELVVHGPDVGGPESVVIGKYDIEVGLDRNSRQGQAGEESSDGFHFVLQGL